VAKLSPSISGASCEGDVGFASDAAKTPVTLDAPNLLDGNPSSGWRCSYRPAGTSHWDPSQGRAIGEWVDFDLGAVTAVTRVGVVPGQVNYDARAISLPKFDGIRYLENGRVTGIHWEFDDGYSFDQSVNPPSWPSDNNLAALTPEYWWVTADLDGSHTTRHVRMTITSVDSGYNPELGGTAKPTEVGIWGAPS